LVAVSPDKSLATVRELAVAAIENGLRVSITRERRKESALLLKRLPNAPALPAGEAKPGSARAGAFDLPKITMPQLADMLGSCTGRRIRDATGLSGDFGVQLSWDLSGGSKALDDGLRAAGFELAPGDVEIEHLIVKPRP